MFRIIKTKAEEYASAAADIVQRVVETNTAPNICFPLGKSPTTLFQELVRRFEAGQLSLKNMRAFGLDEWWGEGFVKEKSAVAQMKDLLYDKTDVQPENIYFIDTSGPDIHQACRDYDALIRRMGDLTLTILGVGMNGHVGFNEPTSQPSDGTRVVTIADKTKEISWTSEGPAPNFGITLGLAPILESKEIVLLINGAHKQEIVYRTVHDEVSDAFPVTFLRDHPNCTLLIDEAAGALL